MKFGKVSEREREREREREILKENGDLYLSDRCVKQSGGWLSTEEFCELAGMKKHSRERGDKKGELNSL